jgi:ribosomal-protein-alanine N-acetyltransferase
MSINDTEQFQAIEKDAFPDLFPETNFKNELNRSIASLITIGIDTENNKKKEILNDNYLSNKIPLYRQGYTGWHGKKDFLVGIAESWNMVGETHIISIGVRRYFQNKGAGETLLLNILSNSENPIVTLEVRKSNQPAINLYKKYKFQIVGTRKKYYSDNGEDALIMTIESATSMKYKGFIEQSSELLVSKENQ